jgi:hypothetical protein
VNPEHDMNEIRPIRTARDHRTALAEIDALLTARRRASGLIFSARGRNPDRGPSRPFAGKQLAAIQPIESTESLVKAVQREPMGRRLRRADAANGFDENLEGRSIDQFRSSREDEALPIFGKR